MGTTSSLLDRPTSDLDYRRSIQFQRRYDLAEEFGIQIARPELKKTNLINNPMHAKPESFVMTTRSDIPFGKAGLEFIVDASCSVIVAVQVLKSSQPVSFLDELDTLPVDPDAVAIPEQKFPAGLGQRYCAALSSLSIKTCPLYLAVLLRMEDSNADSLVCGQKTYASVAPRKAVTSRTKQNWVGRVLDITVLRQTLDIISCNATKSISPSTTVYRVQEVFGLKQDAQGAGRECIICLTEPRNTIVLPCRHVSFCGSCADVVRMRCATCPMCREPVVSLLQFSTQSELDKIAVGTQNK